VEVAAHPEIQEEMAVGGEVQDESLPALAGVFHPAAREEGRHLVGRGVEALRLGRLGGRDGLADDLRAELAGPDDEFGKFRDGSRTSRV